jgi:hypothetical protein
VKKTLFSLSLTLLVTSVIIFIACSKSISSGSGATNPNNIPADVTVTASLQGRVVDENGLPVEGAAVSSGAATTSTDVNGIFSFTSISMSSRFGYVQVAKTGYFMGSRSIITNGGASSYVTIQLVPRNATGSFPAPMGGKVVVGPGDTATFLASSVVTAATNAAYTGMVYVFATYLNPTDPNLYKYMPGDLRGIGSDGNETALQSFGMMGVEMQDASGNKLQLAAGQQATLTMAIPDSLQAIAPAATPLWYFNDSTGKWIQQGTAVRQGNNYVGQVGHFTYWNCDAPIETVNFKVVLKDQFGNPLAYTYIEFESTTLGTRGAYTDATGFAQGLVPKGQSLLMRVVNQCGTLIGGVNVGPALSDQDLGTVTVTVAHAELTLTGTVVDCSNNPVDSGFVNAIVDGLNYRAFVSKGAFTLPVSRCLISSGAVPMLAVDLNSGQQSTVTDVTADTGTVNAGQLTACTGGSGSGSGSGNPGATAQYITYTLVNIPYILVSPNNTIGYNFDASTSISAISGDNTFDLDISQLTSTGTYANVAANVVAATGTYTGMVSVTITTFGPIGSYIKGTFTGPVSTSTGPAQTINGSFQVQRAN